MTYRDRREAGKELAHHLEPYRGEENVRILGLPRGGVPVAYEVALHLQVPLRSAFVCGWHTARAE
jgi:putative phosphoribosyl transferase